MSGVADCRINIGFTCQNYWGVVVFCCFFVGFLGGSCCFNIYIYIYIMTKACFRNALFDIENVC